MKKRFCSILREPLDLDMVYDIHYKETGIGVLCKPDGGLWASPYLEEGDGYASDWHRFIADNHFMNDRKYLNNFELKASAKVFEIVELERLEDNSLLSEKEIYWIKELDTYGSKGYNASTAGDGTVLSDRTEIIELARLGYTRQ